MNKDFKVYVHHMLDALVTIEDYTMDLTETQFMKTKLVQDGVIRNLEIMGEAALIRNVRCPHCFFCAGINFVFGKEDLR